MNKTLPIRLGSIDRILPHQLRVRGVLIISPEGDTLIYAEELETIFSPAGFLKSKVKLDRLNLNHLRVQLSRMSETTDMDIARAFSSAAKTEPPPPDRKKKQWVIQIGSGSLADVGFQLTDVPGGLKISQQLENLHLEKFSLSLGPREIQLGTIELIRSDGGIVLPESSALSKDEPGEPWSFGFRKIAMETFHFYFDHMSDSLLIDFQVEEGDIRAREADIAGKSIDLDRLYLSGAIASLYSRAETSADSTETDHASPSPLEFPWDIRGEEIRISQATVETGNYPTDRSNGAVPESVISGITLEVPRFRLSDNNMLLRLGTLEFASDDLISLDKMSGDLTSEPGSTRLDFTVNTRRSHIRLEGESDRFLMDLFNDPGGISQTRLALLEGSISPEELSQLANSLQDASWFDSLADRPLLLSGEFRLDGQQLGIRQFRFHQPERFEIDLGGSITAPFRPDHSEMALHLEIPVLSSSWFGELLTEEDTVRKAFSWSRLTLVGDFSGRYRSPVFDLALQSDSGLLDVSGNIDIENQMYALRSKAERILLGQWLSVEELGYFTGSLELSGQGFKPEELESSVDLTIDSMDFKGYLYTGIHMTGQMVEGAVSMELRSEDPSLQSDISATVRPFGQVFEAKAEGSIAASLNDLQLYTDTLFVSNSFQAEVHRSEKRTEARLRMDDLKMELPDESATVDSIQVEFITDTSGIRLLANSDFLQLEATVGIPSDSLALLGNAYGKYIVDVIDPDQDDAADRIRYLPAMEVNSMLTYHNVMGILLEDTTLRFSGLQFSLSNDISDQSVHYRIHGDELAFKMLRMKALDISLIDSASSFVLDMSATDNKFSETPVREINLSSRFSDMESETGVSVINRFGEILYDFDLQSRMDSNMMVIIVPSRQLIFNREPWQMSSPELARLDLETMDFYPEFDLHQEHSQIKLNRKDSSAQHQYRLGLNEVNLNSLVVDSILPGNPRAIISGDLLYESDTITGMAMRSNLRLSEVAWSDLAFDSIIVSGNAESEEPGHLLANVEAFLDSSEITLSLSRQDSIMQSLDAHFNAVPLNALQPFANKYVTNLKGNISGSVDLMPEGNTESIAGEVTFHNAALRVKPLNAMYKIRDNNLTFKNNRLVFSRFNVLDSLDNNLQLDGFVDFSNRSAPTANLDISSSRIQVMNRTEEEEGPLYGNASIDSRLTIRGPVRNPAIKGTLHLSGESELYYRQMEDLSLSESEKIITFVSHTPEGSPLPVLPGSRFNRNGQTSVETTLEIDPSARVHFSLAKRIYTIGLAISGGGSLNYQMQGRNQMALSGRYQINEGSAEVKIVGWPNKTFSITEGGYIQWEGKVEDPELNLEAVNRVRTSYLNPVDGKQREVDFNVVLKVIGRLSELGVLFTVDTPDQYLMSIINTLSPEEQMRQAINVLLFESIDLPGISSNNNYMTEQVNQLLASQLNQIAKTSIQGVELSFGIDSYKQATEGGGEETKTSLSYEVRKDFMEGRAQVEVSGRLNDLYKQPGASDFSLNNISFEYQLDSTGTKFLKVYNEHTYEDVFEGEVVATGIGFTYRKRYNRLGDIWRRSPGKYDPEKENTGKKNNKRSR
ncbi:MAG: translocation/assembly module TamB domain-containing protein [Bacteroidales bacterium]